MTIVFITDVFPSISETFILNQVTGLIDLGHDVLIFSNSRSSEKDMHEDIRAYELLKKTYYINDRPSSKIKRVLWAVFLMFAFIHRNPKAVLNSLNVFKYGKEALSLNYFYKVMLFLGVGKVDIILCHYGPNGNFAALMKAMGIKGKIMTMFHGYDIRQGIDQGGGIYRSLFAGGDAILSISDYNRKHLLAFGAPSEKIHDHPVGIDLDRYAFAERTWPLGPVKILSVGRLVKEKGFLFGLAAIHRLIQRLPTIDIRYAIVGDGPQLEELEQQVERLGLKGKVHFYGYQVQKGVVDLLQESHLFFLPSIAEALPIVLMEAQACGLPVVATDVGSIAQEMVDGQSGFLVPSGDVAMMCDKLEQLIKNPGQWKAMGHIGRKCIEEHYDIKMLNRRLAKLCADVAGEQHA